jgi:hypothetical protein
MPVYQLRELESLEACTVGSPGLCNSTRFSLEGFSRSILYSRTPKINIKAMVWIGSDSQPVCKHVRENRAQLRSFRRAAAAC